MVKGIYTASEGMKANLRKQETISNNLANVNTTGYKQTELFTRAMLTHTQNDQRQPFLNDEHTIDEVAVDYRPGPMVQTGNPLDVAIEGEAFFTVMRPDNTVAYTRNGALTIDKDGDLATLNGEKIIGETDKAIPIQGKSVSLQTDGSVVVDGRIVNKLKMGQFEKPYFLVKSGYNLYEKSEQTLDAAPGNFKLNQGHLEGSNVNPVETMVKMISSFRNYESDERAMQASDQTLNKAVNEVGRIR
ncbi:MAG: flagellar basal-body rod protein FlgF [Fibrobacterota bacterium]